MRVPQFIFLRGAPGVGKTTLARSLREFFPCGVTLEIDHFLECFHNTSYKVSSRLTDIFGSISLMGLHLSHQGYGPIIVVGHITERMLQEWIEAEVDGEIRVYTLTASQEVVRQRLTRRKNHGFVDADRSHAIGLRLRSLERFEEIIIDTTALDSAGVCDVILRDLEREGSEQNSLDE